MDFAVKNNLALAQTNLEITKNDKVMGANSDDPAAMRKVSEEFEAMFLELMLKSMRSTVQKSDLTDGGNGEDIFRSLLDGEYAKAMAAQHSSGLAESIEKQLLNLIPEKAQQIDAMRGRTAYRSSTSHVEIKDGTVQERK